MTNLEISKALALAIGWKEPYGDPDVQIVWTPHGDMHVEVWFQDHWRPFDYRDWNVIGPIAERYDCFPYKTAKGDWDCLSAMANLNADTPQKAIALAVIGETK